jgi:hypothetical protein
MTGACSGSSAKLYCIEQPDLGDWDGWDELASFDATATGTAGEYYISVMFPSDMAAIDHVNLMRGDGISGTDPDCSAGSVVNTFSVIATGASDSYTDTTGSDIPYSYRACVYDSIGNLLSSKMVPVSPAATQHVFTTSLTFTGDLISGFADHPAAFTSGVAGADYRCTVAAKNAGLSKYTWKAYLSDNTASVKVHSPLAGMLYDLGGSAIATNEADLYDGSLLNPVEQDEFAVHIGTSDAWVGSTTAGVVAPATCTDWSIGTSGDSGRVAWVENSASNWISSGSNANCATREHINCMSTP